MSVSVCVYVGVCVWVCLHRTLDKENKIAAKTL